MCFRTFSEGPIILRRAGAFGAVISLGHVSRPLAVWLLVGLTNASFELLAVVCRTYQCPADTPQGPDHLRSALRWHIGNQPPVQEFLLLAERQRPAWPRG